MKRKIKAVLGSHMFYLCRYVTWMYTNSNLRLSFCYIFGVKLSVFVDCLVVLLNLGAKAPFEV